MHSEYVLGVEGADEGSGWTPCLLLHGVPRGTQEPREAVRSEDLVSLCERAEFLGFKPTDLGTRPRPPGISRRGGEQLGSVWVERGVGGAPTCDSESRDLQESAGASHSDPR